MIMLSLSSFSDKISHYLEPDQVRLVRRAYYYAEQAHDVQIRRSGEPYITHPLAVADILADMRLDHQSLIAAMLHDVIEDTGISKQAIDRQFGDTVADLVDGVSKLTQIEFTSRAEAQAENFQKMVMAMASDIRVILVKLADRLHNMRTLGAMQPEKRRRIAQETLDIFAPIANRLGMNSMRMEFEDLCFQSIHPMRATRITAAIRSIHGRRQIPIEEARKAIERHLRSEGFEARVLSREKHIYSIYSKMRQRHKSFSDIMDIFGFRIVVDSPDTCYRVLGSMHALYKPVPGRFKDYIAIPKSNGYQSLHTVLIGMHGVPIEVQIRTEQMEEMANNGISAHWVYKQNGDAMDAASGSHKRARQWVQNLLELQQNAGSSLEFIENVKIDLFPDEVYVFTPKGTIIELPRGATPVDFAYALHTDLGNQCVGCYINRRLSALSQPLRSGETVEIIRSAGGQPNPVWLDFVVTGKARSNIRQLLKGKQHEDSVELGRRLLNKALAVLGTQLEQIPQAQIDKLLKGTKFSSFEYILEDIGIGNRVAFLTARQLVPESGQADSHSAADASTIHNKPLVITGEEGVTIQYATCCHPLPGDTIIGQITPGRGIVVHTTNCMNARKIRSNPATAIDLSWASEVKGEFIVPVSVDIRHQRGMVATLATKINSLDANIESINIIDKDAHNSRVDIEISVHDRVHLARIMRHIRNIKSVNRIARVKAGPKRSIP